MPGGPSQNFMVDAPKNVVDSLRQKGYCFVDCYGGSTERPYSDIGLVRESKLVGFLVYRAEGLNLAWKLFTPVEDAVLIGDVTDALSEHSQHLRAALRENPSTFLRTRN